jgi:hypothetical protein
MSASVSCTHGESDARAEADKGTCTHTIRPSAKRQLVCALAPACLCVRGGTLSPGRLGGSGLDGDPALAESVPASWFHF